MFFWREEVQNGLKVFRREKLNLGSCFSCLHITMQEHELF